MSPTHDAATLVTPMTQRKTCAECGEPIVRKRLLVRDWEHIRHCSAACRRLSFDRRKMHTVRRPLSSCAA